MSVLPLEDTVIFSCIVNCFLLIKIVRIIRRLCNIQLMNVYKCNGKNILMR